VEEARNTRPLRAQSPQCLGIRKPLRLNRLYGWVVPPQLDPPGPALTAVRLPHLPVRHQPSAADCTVTISGCATAILVGALTILVGQLAILRGALTNLCKQRAKSVGAITKLLGQLIILRGATTILLGQATIFPGAFAILQRPPPLEPG
jgi:hypothetical protein